MTMLSQNELAKVSFPDCPVTHFHLTETRFECVIDGIHLENQGFIETKVILSISDWNEAVVERFDATENGTIVLPIKDAGELADICECDLQSNEALLAGFEKKSGLWQTIKFKSPSISIDTSRGH